MATTLWHSISAMSSSDSLTSKTHPRIKLRVASYHTPRVIAHQMPKPVKANCVPKLVAMATSISTYGPPSNTWFLRPIRPHNPNGIPIGSTVFAQTTIQCLYILQWDAHSPPKLCPFPWGNLDHHLIHGSPGPPESSTQTAARSVQPFLQGSLVWQTNRQTDHATRSVRIGRIYVHSTAMRPNNIIHFFGIRHVLNIFSRKRVKVTLLSSYNKYQCSVKTKIHWPTLTNCSVDILGPVLSILKIRNWSGTNEKSWPWPMPGQHFH